jgi:hypothetical protein
MLRGINHIYTRLSGLFLHTLTHLWQNNNISNLEYLLYINSLAGNDILTIYTK